jgi:hypothetical protein
MNTVIYIDANKMIVIFCYTKMINTKSKLIKSSNGKGVVVGIEYD